MITVAIGDIHGMQDHLARLLREIAAYAESQGWQEPPRLVFLGDYVDRGPGVTRGRGAAAPSARPWRHLSARQSRGDDGAMPERQTARWRSFSLMAAWRRCLL